MPGQYPAGPTENPCYATTVDTISRSVDERSCVTTGRRLVASVTTTSASGRRRPSAPACTRPHAADRRPRSPAAGAARQTRRSPVSEIVATTWRTPAVVSSPAVSTAAAGRRLACRRRGATYTESSTVKRVRGPLFHCVAYAYPTPRRRRRRDQEGPARRLHRREPCGPLPQRHRLDLERRDAGQHVVVVDRRDRGQVVGDRRSDDDRVDAGTRCPPASDRGRRVRGRTPGPCPGTTSAGDIASTRSREARSTPRSGANGSSAGPSAVHHRCVHTTSPSAVCTAVVMSCGVWPGRLQQPGGLAEPEPLGLPVVPHVVAVDRPVVVEPRVGEQRRVERVVGMVVAEHDVGDLLGAEPERASGSRMAARDATIPGSTTTTASPSRTSATEDATRSPAYPSTRTSSRAVSRAGHAGASAGRTWTRSRRRTASRPRPA